MSCLHKPVSQGKANQTTSLQVGNHSATKSKCDIEYQNWTITPCYKFDWVEVKKELISRKTTLQHSLKWQDHCQLIKIVNLQDFSGHFQK